MPGYFLRQFSPRSERNLRNALTNRGDDPEVGNLGRVLDLRLDLGCADDEAGLLDGRFVISGGKQLKNIGTPSFPAARRK